MNHYGYFQAQDLLSRYQAVKVILTVTLTLHSVFSNFCIFSPCALILMLSFTNHDSQCILPYEVFSYW